MEVESLELHVLHALSQADDFFHILHVDAKLVFSQACGDVGVCVCSHVGVDAEAYGGHFPLAGSNFVDDLQLGDALYIEAEDAFVKSELYFPIAFAHSGKNNLVGRESGLEYLFYLAT